MFIQNDTLWLLFLYLPTEKIIFNHKHEKTMTKAEIVSNISNQIGIDKSDVQVVVEKFMGEIKDSLENGNNVYLRGFGSFIIKTRARKTGRNISKNTAVIIPEHNIPAFKPSKLFVNAVKSKVTI